MNGRPGRALEAVAAVLADLAVGEPRRGHPVRWMGRFLAAGERRLNGAGRRPGAVDRAAGLALVAGGAAAVAALAARAGRPRDGAWRVPAAATRTMLLASTVSGQALVEAGAGVRKALEAGALSRARELVGRNLVGRPTEDLSPTAVASAAIESLAENFADGVVGPLVWHRLAGLPGAVAYRFVNTADAVLGHRTPELRAFGWMAARADDAVNVLPARLAALLLAGCAGAGTGDGAAGLAVALRDARRPASPNAGWPMAALAGTLGVRLEKEGHYVLHAEGRDPRAADIGRAEGAVLAATGAAGLAVSLLPAVGR